MLRVTPSVRSPLNTPGAPTLGTSTSCRHAIAGRSATRKSKMSCAALAALHQVQDQPPQARIRHILAECRAHARPHIGTSAGDGNTRRGQRYSDHAGQRAASRDGHRHVRRSSGMTAVTSISTSHSGRASADTTSPSGNRIDALQPLADHAIDRLPVPSVHEIDHDFADVVETSFRPLRAIL